jgi:hypothetical protein
MRFPVSHLFESLDGWIPDKLNEDVIPEICDRLLEIIVPDLDHNLLSVGKVVPPCWRVHYIADIETKVAQDE